MKNAKWVGLVTAVAFPLLSGYGQAPEAPVPGAPAQAQPTAPINLSPGAAEVVRLAGAGVGDEVVAAYIQNSQAPFNLSADDVLYLKDIGLSPQVTSAMLNHDSTLRNQPQQYAPATVAPAVPPGTAPPTYQWQAPVAPTAPEPAAPPPPQAAAPPPTYVTSAPAEVSYFYNDLSPYGTWVSLEGYGWCWQPRAVVISRGWRPYCDGGHWVYSDVGWYWQSDYSWGWAPFHYGRWYAHPRCGWVWTPDRVWGPAWVTWRVAGDSCGWAPLPPHAEFDVRVGWRYNGVSVGASFGFGLGANAFAFVSFGDFGNHDLHRRRLPPERVTTIYNQTTIINNYVVNNNTIVHQGVPIERVSAASRTPVPRATVRDWRAAPERMPNRDGAVVYRPQLKAPPRSGNMVAAKVDPGNPVIRHPPITTARGERTSAFSSTRPAPSTDSRRTAVQAPKYSSSSSSPKPATSTEYQTSPRTSQRAPAAPAAQTPNASPGSSSPKPASSPQYQTSPRTSQRAPAAPATQTPKTSIGSSGAKSASSPEYQTSPRTFQRSPAAGQTASPAANPHVYYPKTYYQAAEIGARPTTSKGQSASPSSPARSSDPRSRKQN